MNSEIIDRYLAIALPQASPEERYELEFLSAHPQGTQELLALALSCLNV